MTRIELELSDDLVSAVSHAFPEAPLASGVIETLRHVFKQEDRRVALSAPSCRAIDLILARSTIRPVVTEAQFRSARNAGRRRPV